LRDKSSATCNPLPKFTDKIQRTRGIGNRTCALFAGNTPVWGSCRARFPKRAFLGLGYERISPVNFRALLSNPGNTGAKSGTPTCFVKISPSTDRKSVVNAKSRPSFN